MATRPLTKAANKTLLIDARLWTQFNHAKNLLKTGGLAERQAYDIVHAKFFPNGAGTIPSLPRVPSTVPGGMTAGLNPGPPTVPAYDSGKLPLVPLDTFTGKSANRAEVVDWVASKLAVVAEDIDPKTCPSAEAWAMLRWASESPLNAGEFWKSIYKALLPTRTELDEQSRFRDDGRNVLTVIDMMEKRMKNGEMDNVYRTNTVGLD